jgi:phage head maturation protease
MQFFAEIRKTEPQADGTIKVFGVASAPVRDAHGEIVTADAMTKAIADYMKFPAVREMHDTTKAAGRGIEISVDGDGQTQFVAHVVDPIAVQKVKHGVYPGFSIGGRVKKRNAQDHTIIQEIDLMEISLVDRPSCPAAIFNLWKRDDVHKAADDGSAHDNSTWVDRERWDDGFDFFGEGGDRGQSEGPMSLADGGPYRSQTPTRQADDGRGAKGDGWAGKEQWDDGREFFGQGGDPGKGSFVTDPNAGQVRVSGVGNSTVNTAQLHSDVGGTRTGASVTGGGSASSSADYFTQISGSQNLKRIFDMISEMYAAQHRPPVEGAVQKRAFSIEERKQAAASGAAMKDGSLPIENKDDLANAVRFFGRSKNPDAAKSHIKRRAAALGATAMLPDDWVGKGKSVEGSSIPPGGGAGDVATKLSQTDDLLKTALATLERLEVRQRRGVATPEAYRLAKVYKEMPEDELAEVLASDAIAKIANKDEKLAISDVLAKRLEAENQVLLQKLADTNAGLEQLSARVQKLADMPMPTRTAGSVHALGKGDDADGGRQRLSPDDMALAKVAFEGLSEDERVMLLTKVALANPRKMNLDTVSAPPRSIGGSAGGNEAR